MIYDFLEDNWDIVKWVALGIVVLEVSEESFALVRTQKIAYLMYGILGAKHIFFPIFGCLPVWNMNNHISSSISCEILEHILCYFIRKNSIIYPIFCCVLFLGQTITALSFQSLFIDMLRLCDNNSCVYVFSPHFCKKACTRVKAFSLKKRDRKHKTLLCTRVNALFAEKEGLRHKISLSLLVYISTLYIQWLLARGIGYSKKFCPILCIISVTHVKNIICWKK